jgi:ABC-type multidrug transport system permease subunit
MDHMKEIGNRFLRGKNVFRIITGTMTTWILMIAFQADHSTPTEIVLELVVFAALLLVSYVFASVLGEEIIVQRQTSWRRLFEIVLDVSPGLLATLPPFLIFVIASFGIISVKTGLLLSDLSLLAILFLVGFIAGKAIGAVRRGLLDGALAAGIGVGLVILRSMVI